MQGIEGAYIGRMGPYVKENKILRSSAGFPDISARGGEI